MYLDQSKNIDGAWFIINGKKYLSKSHGVQFNMNESYVTFKNKVYATPPRQSCDITIVTDISHKKDFFKLYDNQTRFSMNCYNLIADGCRIKSIDVDINTVSITLDIVSDYVRVKDISDQRDEKIDKILNKTSDTDNNIK